MHMGIERIALLASLAAGLLGCQEGRADSQQLDMREADTVSEVGEEANGCDSCPEMVAIPAGSFVMGSTEEETTREKVPPRKGNPEHPPIEVSISRPFALSKTEITVEQYAAFVEATGHASAECLIFVKDKYVGWLPLHGSSWDKPPFPQQKDHPVTCVSWQDGVAYAEWLSEKTGKKYRLPSESEWEYAARAGTQTARYWGDGVEQACEYANVADVNSYRQNFDCDDGYSHTAPASYGIPNAFGLYGMLGNVGEWTADCGLPDYETQTPRDGAPFKSAECMTHVGRGGSWWNDYYYVRAARRYDTNGAYDVMGFRLAMDLE